MGLDRWGGRVTVSAAVFTCAVNDVIHLNNSYVLFFIAMYSYRGNVFESECIFYDVYNYNPLKLTSPINADLFI